MENYKTLLPRIRPANISDLWERIRKNSSGKLCSIDHVLSENLSLWASDDEISTLLKDEAATKSLIRNMSELAMMVGYYCDESKPLSAQCIFSSPICDGCSNPCDNPAANSSHNERKVVPLMNEPILHAVHRLLCAICITCELLAYSPLKSDALALKMAKGLPRMKATELEVYVQRLMAEGGQLPVLSNLIGLLDNCSICFPKLCHATSALISLIVAHQPAEALAASLDSRPFLVSLKNYLSDNICSMVCNNKCLVDDYFGVVGFINILPLLYHCGSWKRLHNTQGFTDLVDRICTIMINITHWIAPKVGELQNAKAPNLEELPECINAKIYIVRMMAGSQDDIEDKEEDSSDQERLSSNNGEGNKEWRKDLMLKYPKAFAALGAMEVLAWWSKNGIGGLDIVGQVEFGPKTTCRGFIKEYKDHFHYLMDHIPEYEFLRRSLQALIKKKPMPKQLHQTSVLYGALIKFRRKCGLPSCRSRMVMAKCGGGCGGLEYYCSKEHQKEHWKEHKVFCKNHGGV